ncbi:MAG: hypothetical protein PHU98_10980 [Mariniphaga sp.]|nr:hypothetical protein [Mariniphaga sp.]MDD4754838.1 hypothetical protein [Prolixibacteraceae bacterium]
MNDLSKTKLFSLLADPSQMTNQEMQNAYEEFVTQISIYDHSESTLAESFRKLTFTRIELDALAVLPFYGQGGKCLKICISPKNISICQL